MTYQNVRLKYGHALLALLDEPPRRFDATKAKQFIDAGASLYVTNNKGRTALHLAIQRGYTDIALYLIHKNAPITSRGWNGFTPLHNAIACAEDKVVEALLRRGASIKKRTDAGHNAHQLLHANGIFCTDLAKAEKYRKILKHLNEIPAEIEAQSKRDAFEKSAQKIAISQKPLPRKKAQFKKKL